DVLDGIAAARVFRDRRVGVVDLARLAVIDDVLQDRAETDGVVDLGLSFRREVDRLRVAPALDVEDALVAPAVLVVSDERAVRIGAEGRLAGAAEAEEDGDIALRTLVRGAMHREHTLLRH